MRRGILAIAVCACVAEEPVDAPRAPATVPADPEPAAPVEEEEAPAPPDPCAEPTTGTICAWMGVEGEGFYAELGLHRTLTHLNLPLEPMFGPGGQAYVPDWNNHRILEVGLDGTAQVILGVGVIGDGIFDPSTGLWGDGPALEYKINHPSALRFDPWDPSALYVAAWHNSRIVRYDFDTGLVERWAGTGARSFGGDGGPASDAMFDLPSGLVFGPDGSMFVMDQANAVIRRIDPHGTISTVAGVPKETGYTGDGRALEVTLSPQGGRVADPGNRPEWCEGRLYFPDAASHTIRRYDPTAGTIVTIAGMYAPDPVMVDTNGDYVGDLTVGLGGYGGDGGPATAALFNLPQDLAIAEDGTIFVADTNNFCVRRIAPDGIVSTAAGVCGEEHYAMAGEPSAAHGIPATEARLGPVLGVSLDAAGNLYVADTWNQVIRVVWGISAPVADDAMPGVPEESPGGGGEDTPPAGEE